MGWFHFFCSLEVLPGAGDTTPDFSGQGWDLHTPPGPAETRPRRAFQNPQALGWSKAGCRAGKMLPLGQCEAPTQRPHWNLSKPDLLLSPQKCTPHQPPLTTTTTRPSVSSGPNSGIFLDSPFFNTFLKMHSESHPSYLSAGLGPMATTASSLDYHWVPRRGLHPGLGSPAQPTARGVF